MRREELGEEEGERNENNQIHSYIYIFNVSALVVAFSCSHLAAAVSRPPLSRCFVGPLCKLTRKRVLTSLLDSVDPSRVAGPETFFGLPRGHRELAVGLP